MRPNKSSGKNSSFHLEGKPYKTIKEMKSSQSTVRLDPFVSRRLLPWIGALVVVAVVCRVLACSVPVFRYALERWAPDSYGLVVFHKGPLTDEQEALIGRMDLNQLPAEDFVNFMIKKVDLDANPEPQAVELWEKQGTDSLPWLIVYYPWTSRLRMPAWSGELTESNVNQLIDSPARREVARRLLKGESTVWVLLESGQTEKDDAAEQTLTERLAYLEENLQLPEINPQDYVDGFITIEEDKLKIDFSVLRLSRNDPKEAFFVEMLLGSEEDLKEFSEPIVFPIFGRGRSLYALIGDGIADDVIDDAALFLTGACSCQVKEQNPGVDLVMAVDWDRLVQPQLDIDRELPPLSGFVGLGPESKQSEETLTMAASVPESPNHDGVDQAPTEPTEDVGVPQKPSRSMNAVIVNSLIVCGIGGLGALALTVILMRKK